MGKFKRAMAITSLITTIAGVPANPSLTGTSRDLAKQYGSYAKEVRAPQTRRDIERTIAAATHEKATAQKSTTALTKKNIKRLK
jgi:phage terminase Nu1 subunit (DNA packaging protein)